MNREEVKKAVTDHENRFPVENYRIYDWNAWPLLRSVTAHKTLIPASRKKHSRNSLSGNAGVQHLIALPGVRDIYRAIASRSLNKRLEQILATDSKHNSAPFSSGKDIVFITLSERRQKHHQCLYEIYTDPLVDYFNRRDITTAVWEKGAELTPRCNSSTWISKRLQIEILEEKTLRCIKEPPWFRHFAYLYNSMTRSHIHWRECEKKIQSVQQLSKVFEKWLLRSEARLLITVCWYDPVVMAATLAARKLNIPSVDLQHGLQDHDHFAYSGWQKTPSKAYELVPDFFWSWGSGEANRLMEENPAFKAQCKTVAGGNMWYNLWREDRNFDTSLPERIFNGAPREKTILVTLQHGPANFAELIFKTITECPTDWFWLIRLHPATPGQEAQYIRDSLNSIGMDNTDYAISSKIALYTLFSNCDLHITGHSTSALEALGFGVPTITVTENGTSAFRKYIDQGVIMKATTSNKIKAAIEISSGISGDNCKNSVSQVFAPTAEASQGINELLSVANIRGN